MATIKLFENWLQSQAINELAPHGEINLQAMSRWAEWVPNKTFANEGQNLYYEKIKTTLKRNGIIFHVSQEDAATILTNFFIKLQESTGYTAVDQWLTKTGDIKLMDSPEDPTKVLTQGEFTPSVINEPMDDSMSSDYKDIAEYCNNSALMAVVDYFYRRVSNSGAGLNGGGYILSIDPTKGTLTWDRSSGFKMKLYGTTVTASAQSKQVATTTTWEVPATGKTIVKKLPGTMFATGAATLADSKELDAAIAELKALIAADKNTKLSKIEVESSASGDRPAADGKSGYPANHPKGTPYIAKTAAESGNAKLAFDRAATIITKLASLGVPTSTKAIIQDGGDAAQYAKLIVTVQKVDKPTEVLTKTDLETILLKPKQTTDMASSKTLSVWNAATNYQGK